jgi:hypothetical protein
LGEREDRRRVVSTLPCEDRGDPPGLGHVAPQMHDQKQTCEGRDPKLPRAGSPEKVLGGGVQVSEPSPGCAPHHEGSGVAGLTFEDGTGAVESSPRPPKPKLAPSEVGVRLEIVGVDGGETRKVGAGLGKALTAKEQEGEVSARGREPGIDRERAHVGRLGLVEVTAPLADDAEARPPEAEVLIQ